MSAAGLVQQMVTHGEAGSSKLLPVQSLPEHLAEHHRRQALHATPSGSGVWQVNLVSREGLQFTAHSRSGLPWRRARQATTGM